MGVVPWVAPVSACGFITQNPDAGVGASCARGFPFLGELVWLGWQDCGLVLLGFQECAVNICSVVASAALEQVELVGDLDL